MRSSASTGVTPANGTRAVRLAAAARNVGSYTRGPGGLTEWPKVLAC